jgi:hypothetical protein
MSIEKSTRNLKEKMKFGIKSRSINQLLVGPTMIEAKLDREEHNAIPLQLRSGWAGTI